MPAARTQAHEALRLALLQGISPQYVVAQLRQLAAIEDPAPSWRVLNDLSATLLTTGESLSALEAALAASRKAPDRIEPVFNAGLSAQILGLGNFAETQWQGFLSIESDKRWRREANDRLDSLLAERREREAGSRRQPSVEQLERVLIPEWLVRASTSGSGSGLRAQTAGAERRSPLLRLNLAKLRGEVERRDLDPRLATAYADYRLAEESLEAEAKSKAGPIFERALRVLDELDSPLRWRAKVRSFWAEKPDETQLDALVQDVLDLGLTDVAAEAERIRAFYASLEGRLIAGLEGYRKAAELYAQAGSAELATVCQMLEAEILAYLGLRDESLGLVEELLPQVPRISDPWQRYSAMWVAGATLIALGGFEHAGLELWEEAMSICSQMPRRVFCAVDSDVRIAEQLEDEESAARLEAAATSLSSWPDREGKDRSLAELLLRQARSLVARTSATGANDPTNPFKEAMRLFDRSDLPILVAQVGAELGHHLRATGRQEEAKHHYQAALEQLRRWDQNAPSSARFSGNLVPQVRPVFEGLIATTLADLSGKDASAAALVYAEEYNLRSLPSLQPVLNPAFSQIQDAILHLPLGVAVAIFFELRIDDQVLVWVVQRGRLELKTLGAASTITDLTRRLRKKMESGDGVGFRIVSAELGEKLVEPLTRQLPVGIKRLVLVPNGVLFDVPFPALPGGEQIALGQRYEVSYAPGLTQLRSERSRPVRRVAAWGFSDHTNLGLEDLPQAAEEAREVRAHYLASSTCEQHWQGFVDCAPKADVLHLATHSQSAANPTASWLAFEEQTVTADRLWTELPSLRDGSIVILSSCTSASGSSAAGLGGLARPFLAHGAGTVVGTLWPVTDAQSRRFADVLHQHIARGQSVQRATAIAAAEVDAGGSRPWVSAAYVVISKEVL